LQNCILVGQSDKKFIFIKSKADGSILCIDQHAADERIQLEMYESKFVNAMATRDQQEKNHENVGTVDNVHGSYVVNETISVRPREEEHILMYAKELHTWKFDVAVVEDEPEQDHQKQHEKHSHTGTQSLLSMFVHATKGTTATAASNTSTTNGGRTTPTRTKLHVKSLPTLFGIRLSIGDMRAFVQELHDAKGHIQLSHPTARRPTFVTRCLNSLACKRAIKFGKALTRNECQHLIAALISTKLPFQCAHGRPTVVPIALGDVSQGLCHAWNKNKRTHIDPPQPYDFFDSDDDEAYLAMEMARPPNNS
jgi:DNA mismatch repair ATPase MutL